MTRPTFEMCFICINTSGACCFHIWYVKHGSVRTVQFNLVETSEIQYLLYEDHSERRFKFLMECLHVLLFPKLECLCSMMKDYVFVDKFLSLRSNIRICIIFKAKSCLSSPPIVTF